VGGGQPDRSGPHRLDCQHARPRLHGCRAAAVDALRAVGVELPWRAHQRRSLWRWSRPWSDRSAWSPRSRSRPLSPAGSSPASPAARRTARPAPPAAPPDRARADATTRLRRRLVVPPAPGPLSAHPTTIA